MDVNLTATNQTSNVRMAQWLFNPWLERLTPQDIVHWAVEAFGPGLIMTSSFGLNGVALIHMLQAVRADVPVVFVDTGYLFDETLQTKRRIEAAYHVSVLTYRPRADEEAQPGYHGQTTCCNRRKVEPMRRALAELRPVAVLNARARFQARTRHDLPMVEWDQAPVRINPLAGWSLARLKAYVAEHNIPYNPLHDAGYPSIGCWPCTRPVQPGEDLRAGRWAGSGKVECGLWTQPGTAAGAGTAPGPVPAQQFMIQGGGGQ
jgi:phosphoadenosine phosphosulfate reductase